MTLDYRELRKEFIMKQQKMDKLQAQKRIKQAQQIVKKKRLQQNQ